MKNLKAIIEKYSQISHNADNYEIGGGLDSGKFASRRHEDAKNDFGKLTLGKAAQMFKKAVGSDDVEFIKEVLSYAVPNMEWHHAGKLPKQYGGGMKKTYFLNSYEIVKIAENWDDYTQKLELSKADKRKAAELQKSREEVQQEFLKLNAEKVTRVSKVQSFSTKLVVKCRENTAGFLRMENLITCQNITLAGSLPMIKLYKNF